MIAAATGHSLFHPEPALFAIAGMALLLMYVGIHNVWNTVTYVAVGSRKESK